MFPMTISSKPSPSRSPQTASLVFANVELRDVPASRRMRLSAVTHGVGQQLEEWPDPHGRVWRTSHKLEVGPVEPMQLVGRALLCGEVFFFTICIAPAALLYSREYSVYP